MKKINFTLGLLFFSLVTYCSVNPILDFVIFDNEELEVTIDNNQEKSSRLSVKFFKNVLSFRTIEKIKNIQVYNKDGKLLYQIPIVSKKVEISKELFDSGKYKVNFYFYGDNTPLSTQIVIKK